MLPTKSIFPQTFGEDQWNGLEVRALFKIQDVYRPPFWILSRDHFLPRGKVAANKISLRSKFDEDRWTGVEVRAMILNLRWRTVAILDFVSESLMLSCKSRYLQNRSSLKVR